jgi:hypothetical protein
VIIYQADKRQFLKDVGGNDIESVVLNSYTNRTGKRVSRQEFRSWASSLAYMGKVLYDDDIPDDCGVAIEYTIPQTAMRVDFLLTGKTEDDQGCVIVVELKQWDKVKKTTKDAIVSTRFAAGEQEVAHPSYQAWSYAALLKNFNEAVYTGGIELRPCAYLHNYPKAAATSMMSAMPSIFNVRRFSCQDRQNVCDCKISSSSTSARATRARRCTKLMAAGSGHRKAWPTACWACSLEAMNSS